MDPGAASSSPGSTTSPRSSPATRTPSRSTRPRWRSPPCCVSADVDGALDALDELAAACPAPTFEGLRRHLFDELGFAGDAEHYDDPRNSFLDVVLARAAACRSCWPR